MDLRCLGATTQSIRERKREREKERKNRKKHLFRVYKKRTYA